MACCSIRWCGKNSKKSKQNRRNHISSLLLLAGMCLMSFTSGIVLAFPSVLNPAILSNTSDIKATPDQASWIAASHGFAGLIGYAILAPIFEVCGRKIVNITTNLFLLFGCLIYCVANDVYALVFARLAQGLSIGGTFISVFTLCECTPPKRRGYFTVLNKISLAVGSLACHSLAFFLNWRQIATLGALPVCLSIIILVICSESPSYFAKHGRFEECIKAFHWFRGMSPEAKKELKEFIAAQTDIFELKKQLKDERTFESLKKTLRSAEFQKSFLIVTLATLCLDACGRYFLLAYITQILFEVTKNIPLSMYISMASDCMLILALSISCGMVRYFRRRTLLFRLGFCSVFLMFSVSVSSFFRTNLYTSENLIWLTPSLILAQSFVSNIALVPVTMTIIGEVFSLEYRSFGLFSSGILYMIFFTLVMKLTPMMLDETGVEGTYAIYGLCLLICLVLLQMILPETKDKTLQEIEDEIKGAVRKNSETELDLLTKA